MNTWIGIAMWICRRLLNEKKKKEKEARRPSVISFKSKLIVFVSMVLICYWRNTRYNIKVEYTSDICKNKIYYIRIFVWISCALMSVCVCVCYVLTFLAHYVHYYYYFKHLKIGVYTAAETSRYMRRIQKETKNNITTYLISL